ncbi:hypothetical protein [Anaeromyxobacter oryzae]|uniref:hypothetical protein n=1 Tax=Anaeromyxobacter oryzae TaxID=2918170 RepID=UPI0020BFBF73|nr:hypothetical protein [Anaeromyxobacter oryzae]
MIASFAALLLLACRPPFPVEPAKETTVAVPARCATEKLRFTQATGCQNDGSVEFCVARGDATLEAKVRSIAPSVRTGASRGRAGCDPAVETLYFYPTLPDDPSVCTSRHGAVTDRAWQELCRLASLSEIRRIVPTWYE